MSHDWISDSAELQALVARLAGEARYALDTEFHRERTFFPRLALVQLAWSDGLALVDPLACDIRELAPLLRGPALAVLHASQQDLEVLAHACGAVPSRLYDTQLAAGFLGYSTPSLSSLVHGELRITLPKGDRLTDWLRRPLTADQRSYAASDVAHLLELHDRLEAQLVARGRDGWAAYACEEFRGRPQGPGLPEDAWLRVKDARTLKARGRGVARSICAWRERRAMELDIPVRHVLSDLAVLGIAQKAPQTAADLAAARGVDERHSRGSTGADIIAAVRRGLEEPADFPQQDVDELDRRLRPAVTLVSAWVSEVARRREVDTSLLATRSDLVAFLRGDADARLATGWRQELVGDDIGRIVRGAAALSFDGVGGLRLIDATPVAVDTPNGVASPGVEHAPVTEDALPGVSISDDLDGPPAESTPPPV